MTTTAPRIPREKEDDYTADVGERRREFLREQTGASLEHVGGFSFDPGVLPGNVENYVGVAQVPIGVAGPLRINGEHAQGDFYVPLATTEGTLVASYNRGMRLLSECGGVKTTVVDDQMQRAPAFIFNDALQAREFGEWIDAHCDGSGRRRRRPRGPESSRTSGITRSARCATCGSTTPQAMQPART
jgi:hydroxymethylglutaryl-CoA reductase (NADPH)